MNKVEGVTGEVMGDNKAQVKGIGPIKNRVGVDRTNPTQGKGTDRIKHCVRD